jgi:hypothetical protein
MTHYAIICIEAVKTQQFDVIEQYLTKYPNNGVPKDTIYSMAVHSGNLHYATKHYDKSVDLNEMLSLAVYSRNQRLIEFFVKILQKCKSLLLLRESTT